jgi:hypothetical protein
VDIHPSIVLILVFVMIRPTYHIVVDVHTSIGLTVVFVMSRPTYHITVDDQHDELHFKTTRLPWRWQV